jgi:hypothetical protein
MVLRALCFLVIVGFAGDAVMYDGMYRRQLSYGVKHFVQEFSSLDWSMSWSKL